MTKLLLLLTCLISPVIAQTIPEGVGQGYDGEFKHVTSQLLALAEAHPRTSSRGGQRPVCALRVRCTCTSPSPIFIF